jgi:hypothetical protein
MTEYVYLHFLDLFLDGEHRDPLCRSPSGRGPHPDFVVQPEYGPACSRRIHERETLPLPLPCPPVHASRWICQRSVPARSFAFATAGCLT